MASTSTPPDELELPLEVRKEITRLRSLMYENSCVRLSTSNSDGGRWLTDGYVCLDVTDSVAVASLNDGQYKLTAGKGLVRLYWQHKDVNGGEPVPRPSEFAPDAYFDKLAAADWQPATPTEWSVAEHPGKAMLFNASGIPALMGEETWTTLHRQFGEDISAEYAMNLPDNVFRILYGTKVVLAYVAGIRVPDGQEDHAYEIVRIEERRATA